MGRLTQPNTSPDLRPTFSVLYEVWTGQGKGQSLQDLSKALAAHGARMNRHMLGRFHARSEPKSAHATRQPPLWLLLWLCEQTGRHLELGPDAVLVVARG